LTSPGGVTALAVLAVGVGIVDGINPSTVAPAIILALRPKGQSLLGAFAAGVFAVSTVAGVAVVLGPGRFLLQHAPHLGDHTKHVLALVAGAGLLVAAALVWWHRHAASRVLEGRTASSPAAAATLGAGIMAVELPTAFPYFAVLAAVIASREPTTVQLGIVLLYNVAFVAPLAVIAALRLIAGASAAGALARLGKAVVAYGPAVVVGALVLAGSALLAYGAAGVVGR
jgi:Sap, sulfolipid-1-addressing protein